MENDRQVKNYEQEKSHERKRKAEYLESIFDNVAKKPSQDRVNNNKEGLLGKDLLSSSKHNGGLNGSVCVSTENPSMAKNSLGNGSLADSVHQEANSSKNLNTSQKMQTSSNCTSPGSPKPGIKSPSECQSDHYPRFHATNLESNGNRTPTRERGEEKSAEFNNGVTVKQEQTSETESLPVQIVSVQGRREEKTESDDNGDIGDDYLKFLLFAGKLYYCERVSDITHNYSRFGTESLQGRKGKVVVLLLFHKVFREVVNYVVGVVDHATLEEQTIVIRIIKSHTYPSTCTSAKDMQSKTSKLSVGSKKLLYNLQTLQGPIYNEFVKILDGFGANSSVDHSKISEFNAMINANADRLDAQLSNYLITLPHSLSRTSSARTFVSSTYGYLGPHVSQSNIRYRPLAIKPTHDGPYSPVKSHGETFSNLPDRSKSGDRHNEVEHGYLKRTYTLEPHSRSSKAGHPLCTVATHQTVHVNPGTYHSSTNNETFRASTEIPHSSSIRFHCVSDEKITMDGSIVSQRRNAEDLQTVAELCKEKMKRDMAEQELKSIKAAFEEFKSQMQHHLSQVEERMVLLEAENRNLKGKLSNMHQTNGFAEKKYHELRSGLEELLKST